VFYVDAFDFRLILRFLVLEVMKIKKKYSSYDREKQTFFLLGFEPLNSIYFLKILNNIHFHLINFKDLFRSIFSADKQYSEDYHT